jgi:dihydrofolate synthase/folylpolyglutamate synthase
MALLAFSEAQCDLAVIEVGLGGTYDATNVVQPAVTVITQLDYEHTQILGDTLAEIAENKAGIIKAGIPVITVEQDPEALAVIEATADRLGAPLFVAGRDLEADGAWRDFAWRNPERTIEHLRAGMAGSHQRENASLAIAVWWNLAALGLDAPDDAIRAGIRATSLPGRFERVNGDERCWILDGAHTPIAAAALAGELLDEFGSSGFVIAGFLNDKHPEPFLAALSPAIAALILTEPSSPRALPSSELAPIARSVISQVTVSPTLDTSMKEARMRTKPGATIVITGSLMLVAQARERLGLAAPDPAPSER